VNLRAGQHEGAQVLVGAAQMPPVEDRLDGKCDHRLGDESARPRLDAPPEKVALLLGRRGTHEHPVAARGVDSLHHQLFEMLEHVAAVVIDRADVRVHVGQDRILVEVVADDRRDQRVHGLVVRHPVAEPVGDCDVARPVGVHQAGHPDERFLAPEDRIEPLVVEPPVDDVDGPQAARRAHEDLVLVDHEVGAFHQLDAHLLGQVQVLVVGGVVDPGGQQHDRRVIDPRRREPAEVAKKLMDVAFDRPHRIAREQIWQDPLHDVPVGQHVRDARRGPQVVFEHEELALVVSNQVDAGDLAVNAVRHGQALDLPHVLRAAEHDLRRDRTLLQDELGAVDVVQEQVQRRQPLLETRLEAFPGPGRDHARDDVEGEDLLVALLVRVDGEGDPVVAKHLHGELVAALQLGRAEPVQALVEPAVDGPRLAVSRKHFVIEAVGLVGGT